MNTSIYPVCTSLRANAAARNTLHGIQHDSRDLNLALGRQTEISSGINVTPSHIGATALRIIGDLETISP